jgi:hypothetical protein
LCEQRISSGPHSIEVDLRFPNGSRAIQQSFIGISARKLVGYLFGLD